MNFIIYFSDGTSSIFHSHVANTPREAAKVLKDSGGIIVRDDFYPYHAITRVGWSIENED